VVCAAGVHGVGVEGVALVVVHAIGAAYRIEVDGWPARGAGLWGVGWVVVLDEAEAREPLAEADSFAANFIISLNLFIWNSSCFS